MSLLSDISFNTIGFEIVRRPLPSGDVAIVAIKDGQALGLDIMAQDDAILYAGKSALQTYRSALENISVRAHTKGWEITDHSDGVSFPIWKQEGVRRLMNAVSARTRLNAREALGLNVAPLLQQKKYYDPEKLLLTDAKALLASDGFSVAPLFASGGQECRNDFMAVYERKGKKVVLFDLLPMGQANALQTKTAFNKAAEALSVHDEGPFFLLLASRDDDGTTYAVATAERQKGAEGFISLRREMLRQFARSALGYGLFTGSSAPFVENVHLVSAPSDFYAVEDEMFEESEAEDHEFEERHTPALVPAI